MRKTIKRGPLFTALVETLESRRLLAAFQLFVDGNAVPAPTTVNYGTLALNAAQPSHTFTFKNLDNATYSVDARLQLGESGQDFLRTGDVGSKDLGKNQSYTVTYKMSTARATPRLRLLDFSYIDPADSQEKTRTFTLTGNILPGNVNNDADFGPLTNSNKASNGKISAIMRSDGEADTLEQVNPYLAGFNLPSASSRVDLAFTATSIPQPGSTDNFVKGKLDLLLAKDSNGDGKLSIAERENPVAKLTTEEAKQNQPSTKSTSKTLGSGKYLVFISANDMDPSAFDDGSSAFIPNEMKFDMSLKVDDIAAPAFEVRGNNVVINDDDSTPAASDGTSFGSITQGQTAPTLTFSVKNTGEGTLNIDGQRPNVSGDFVIVEGLNSSLNGGASDTFQVRLISTTPGEKSGTVVIQSPNASGGNFTFKVGGTVVGNTPPPPPTGDFAVKSGGTLTLTGTSGNDTLTSTVSGSNIRFTLNGEDSPNFVTADLTKIVINLLDGNDNYSSATQLDIKQTINGGAGNDLLRGGKQADVINGGDGDDRMDGRTRGDAFNGEGGSDTAIYRQRRATEPLTISIDELPNDGGSTDQSKDNVLSSTEHVQGGLGNDRLTGSSKTNRLFGFEGNDTIVGLKGNDTLDGGAGNNVIDGGFGNDALFSRNSIADTIDGGADIDSLLGDEVDTRSNVETLNLA